MGRSAEAGAIFSERSDFGNWSLWTHYAGGEDADVTIATSPPPMSGRPSITLTCKDGNPVKGVVTVRVDPSQPSRNSAPITLDFGRDNGSPIHFTGQIDNRGEVSISTLGTVLEVALRLRNTQRLTITINDAQASFDVSGFQQIEQKFLKICTTTH